MTKTINQHSQNMIFHAPPPGFNPKFEIVSCFCETNGKILLLHRSKEEKEGNTWGVPGGKIESGETMMEAIIRELREETALQIPPQALKYFDKVYVRYPSYDFVYHMFHAALEQEPEIRLDPNEHKDFWWARPKEAVEMDLIMDEDECIKLFYKIEID